MVTNRGLVFSHRLFPYQSHSQGNWGVVTVEGPELVGGEKEQVLYLG